MRTRTLSAVLVSLFLVAGCAPVGDQASPVESDSTGGRPTGEAGSGALPTGVPVSGGTSVEYGRSASGALTGYLALPSGDGPHPTTVLIHEWWGLNDSMRDMARKFADQGYVALAVDLYDGKSTTDQAEAGKLAGAVRADSARALENLKQAVAYLKVRPEVDDAKLASVGWCFGGGWSYQMAKNDLGMNATVMYYGQFDPHDDFAHMKADIQGHFGAEDQSIKVDTVKEFETALKTHNGLHEVFVYPNAGHGFANADNAAAYNEEAAEVAWGRTMDFLGRALSN